MTDATKVSVKIQSEKLTVHITYYTSHADPSGRAWGLRPFACWDCGFESHRGHGCLSLVSVVRCQLRVSASGKSPAHMSSTESGLSGCDREASTVREPMPTRNFTVPFSFFDSHVSSTFVIIFEGDLRNSWMMMMMMIIIIISTTKFEDFLSTERQLLKK